MNSNRELITSHGAVELMNDAWYALRDQTAAGGAGEQRIENTKMTLQDFALRYSERSLPVFPVRGKLPLTAHGFKDATTDASTIRGWWEQWRDANIAMPTGRASGLIVVDVDPRHGGDASLAALEEKYGPLPETLESRTGGGGTHFF